MHGWGIVRTILCVIGGATVVAAAGLSACIAGLTRIFPLSEDTEREVTPSPDAAMQAVVVTRIGGGAISPYCITSVAVVPSEPGSAEGSDAADEVFGGNCSALPGTGETGTREVPVLWRDAATLQIRIKADGSSITPRDRDRTGRVKIVFVFVP